MTAVKTNRGRVECGAVVQAVAGASSVVAKKAGIPLPIHCYPLQAMVTQPYKPILTPHVSSPHVHVYVHQTSRGAFVIGGGSDPYPLYHTRATLDQAGVLGGSKRHLFAVSPWPSWWRLKRFRILSNPLSSSASIAMTKLTKPALLPPAIKGACHETINLPLKWPAQYF